MVLHHTIPYYTRPGTKPFYTKLCGIASYYKVLHHTIQYCALLSPPLAPSVVQAPGEAAVCRRRLTHQPLDARRTCTCTAREYPLWTRTRPAAATYMQGCHPHVPSLRVVQMTETTRDAIRPTPAMPPKGWTRGRVWRAPIPFISAAHVCRVTLPRCHQHAAPNAAPATIASTSCTMGVHACAPGRCPPCCPTLASAMRTPLLICGAAEVQLTLRLPPSDPPPPRAPLGACQFRAYLHVCMHALGGMHGQRGCAGPHWWGCIHVCDTVLPVKACGGVRSLAVCCQGVRNNALCPLWPRCQRGGGGITAFVIEWRPSFGGRASGPRGTPALDALFWADAEAVVRQFIEGIGRSIEGDEQPKGDRGLGWVGGQAHIKPPPPPHL